MYVNDIQIEALRVSLRSWRDAISATLDLIEFEDSDEEITVPLCNEI